MVRRGVVRTSLAGFAIVATASCVGPGPSATVPFGGAAPRIEELLPVPEPIPAGPAGSVITSETLDPNADLPGVVGHRMLYRSTDGAGRPIAVSGYVVVPAGTPPPGGWPVLSWAHGTVGVTDACAPSRFPERRLYGVWNYDAVPDLLAAGVMVVATDYPGLGTDGPHAYLDGRPAGRAVLDAARAAAAFGGSDEVVVEGFSQGGHAALWAGRLAPSYAPDLDVRGVSAIAPASHLAFAQAILPALSTSFEYPGLIAYGRLVADRSLNPGDVFTPAGLAKLAALDDRECWTPWFDAGDFRANVLQLPAWVTSLANNEPGNGRIAAPVLLVQGTADTSVPQIASELLCNGLGANGTRATLWRLPGDSHVGSVVTSADARHAWTLDLLAGEDVDPTAPAGSFSHACRE